MLGPLRRWVRAVPSAALVWLAPSTTAGATPPAAASKFVFESPNETGPLWTATAQAGLSATTGNSQALSASASAAVARRSGSHKLSAELACAFVQTRVFVANEQDGIPGIGPGEIRTAYETTSRAWSVRGRYDRLLGGLSSLYLSAGIAADEPAGKRLLLDSQVGYRHVLLHREKQELATELGYDFTDQKYVVPGSISIQSGRLFLGYRAEPDPTVGLDASLELLTNLSAEATPAGHVGPLGDNRIAALLGATVKVFTGGGVGLRLTVLYDSAPAPRPPIPGFTYEPGFLPLADRLDTKTELVLVWHLF